MALLSKSATESQKYFLLFLFKKKDDELWSDILEKKIIDISGKGQSSSQKDKVFKKTII